MLIGAGLIGANVVGQSGSGLDRAASGTAEPRSAAESQQRGNAQRPRTPVARAIEALLDGTGSPRAEAGAIADQYYAQRAYEPAWLDAPGRTAASVLLVRLAAAHEHALCAPVATLERLRERLHAVSLHDHTSAAELDVEITRAIARFAIHLGLGFDAATDRESSRRDLDVAAQLDALRTSLDVERTLAAIAPQHVEYARLRDAFARYRELRDDGGWTAPPPGLMLRAGDETSPEVLEAIRDRLIATGDLDEALLEAIDRAAAAASSPADDAGTPPAHDPGTPPTVIYTEQLAEAVRRFQRRHGLLVDGIVGPETVRAMRVPVEDRLRQIALNMDRWRRLPDSLGDRHVRVNVPAFDLRLVEHGETALQMRVVVGTPSSPTPIFSDRIRYLQFRPFWNVPNSIARGEIVPRAAEDPGYLTRRGYQVLEGWSAGAEVIDPHAIDWQAERFRYRIRQRPGPRNALGLVKFMFPNRYNVYLHDTPAKHLFDRHRRAFSHGCVRVERPAALASALLRDQGEWSVERARQAMEDGTRRAVGLEEPVPVHLLYFTAWAEPTGIVQFRRDIYGRDRAALGRIGCDPARL